MVIVELHKYSQEAPSLGAFYHSAAKLMISLIIIAKWQSSTIYYRYEFYTAKL